MKYDYFIASRWRNRDIVLELLNKLEDKKKKYIGKSAYMEAGIAYGLKKKCILIGEQKEAESLYLIFNEKYPTIDRFIDSL